MSQTDLRDLFAARIIQARTQKGWSQADLARQLNASSGFVCDYEKGRHSATLDTVARFADALKVTPAWLLTMPTRS